MLISPGEGLPRPAMLVTGCYLSNTALQRSSQHEELAQAPNHPDASPRWPRRHPESEAKANHLPSGDQNRQPSRAGLLVKRLLSGSSLPAASKIDDIDLPVAHPGWRHRPPACCPEKAPEWYRARWLSAASGWSHRASSHTGHTCSGGIPSTRSCRRSARPALAPGCPHHDAAPGQTPDPTSGRAATRDQTLAEMGTQCPRYRVTNWAARLRYS